MEAQLRPGAREAIFAQLVDAGRAEQVAQRLTDAIVLGVLSAGERLPSEPELAKRFGVALITVREGLGILRDAGLVETRRGREGGSFVIERDVSHQSVLIARIRSFAHVDLADMAVYFSTIAEGCAERAATRSSPRDAERIERWLRHADYSSAAAARTNCGGFFIELAVLSQSARLVREQIRLQAEFGPILLLGMESAAVRRRTQAESGQIVTAIAGNDSTLARSLVASQVRALAEWLLAAKSRIQRGGELHESPTTGS